MREKLMGGGFSDLVFFEFVVEGAAADTEAIGGLLFVPAAIVQDLLQKPFLVFYQGRWFTSAASGDGRMDCGRQVRGLDPTALGQDSGMFNCVFQFTDIPRPVVVKKEPHGLRAKRRNVLTLLRGETVQEMTSEKRDVVSPLTQKWKVDRNHIETIVQIFPEMSLLHLL